MWKNQTNKASDFIDSIINHEEGKKYLYTLALASPPLFSFLKEKKDYVFYILKNLNNTYDKYYFLEILKETNEKNVKDIYLSHLIRIFIKDFFEIVPKNEAWKEHSFLIEALIIYLFENYKKKYEDNEHIKNILNNIFILGMGKLASLEINYRSDIDLIFIYNGKIEKKDKIFFDNIIKEFIKELEKYFIVDTRLRPFGSRGPLLISLEDFENYLFKFARPWEKLAYFRSKVILGPKEKIKELEDLIKSFVFSSLENIKEEIIKLKNLLVEHKEKLDLINIKEGQGGIRFIEFLAQGLSLIFSKSLGKDKIFRKDTLSLLEILTNRGILLKEEYKILKQAYIFFRDIEHLLQLRDFKPRYSFHLEGEEAKTLAQILNLDYETFKEKILNYRKKVTEIFKRYFEEQEKVYFSSLTRRKLKLLGFKNYEKLYESYKNIISAKEFLKPNFEKVDALFEKLLPYLLEGKYKDKKFENFLKFIQNPLYLNYFYQIKDEPLALKILTYILETSYFTDIFLKYTELLEEIFTQKFLKPKLEFLNLVENILNTKDENRKKLKQFYELSLYLGYKTKNLDIKSLAYNYSLLAHTFVYAISKEMEFPSSIYALGKLGGYELLFLGDLDLIFVASSLEEKNKSLKLASKLVNKLMELEFDIDLRLRPYGNQSEIVIPISYYKKYFEKIARLWERLAYTKAKDLYKKFPEFELLLKSFIFKKDLEKQDLKEILNLLNKLIETYHTENPVKYSKGGLIALEFVSFTYQLFHKFKEHNLYKVLKLLKEETKFDFLKDYIFLKELELETKLHKDDFYLLEEEKKKIKEIEKKVETYFEFLENKLS